ncbi:MAG TPA: EamA family transporter [Candidatus Nanoarchaeia archaeon]|nr:EamA family transporter [Candidatus Nanoarchaeia archaeon]
MIPQKEWFVFAILALIMWGLWGFFPKLSTNYINPKSALVYEVLGSVIVGVIIFFLVGFKPEVHPKGIIFALLTGIAATLGTLFFLYAVSRGKASTTVVITALYPLITIMLALLILHEPISLKQGIGMLLALAAIILVAI